MISAGSASFLSLGSEDGPFQLSGSYPMGRSDIDPKVPVLKGHVCTMQLHGAFRIEPHATKTLNPPTPK